MNYIIRRVCLNDAEHLQQYLRDISSENLPQLHARTTPPSRNEVTALIEAPANHPNLSLLIVASNGERLVGMLDADINKKPQRSHCVSFGMSVLNAYRRQGIGTELLKALFLWSKLHHIQRLELEVFSNNYSALKLYEKMGFLVEGIKEDAVQVESGYVDIIEMVHHIDPHDQSLQEAMADL